MSGYSRRQFLHTVVISAGTMMLSSQLGGCNNNDDEIPVQVATGYFPQSLASGDPKANSVVLWTRLAESATGDFNLRLQVANTADFAQKLVDSTVTAYANHDHCVKVKVIRLTPAITYYYRFLYLKNGVYYATKTAKTKTAPVSTADVSVKFGFVSCQDYIGRYYNPYVKLLDEQADFFIHLGDYVYESTGDPSFQNASGVRVIQFTDQVNAITAYASNGQPYYLAASLDNYRQLYRTYRSDALLQEVHEAMPMIPIWDDHEFADDCWGATATTFDERRNELSISRRQNAERAWLEYMPVDLDEVSEGSISVNEATLYPNNRIYREFYFGKHLHLIMTDYRSYRPDHLIREDAFPATVVLDEATLQQLISAQGLDFQTVRNSFLPYFNIDLAELATLKVILTAVVTQAYLAEGIATADAQQRASTVIRGNLDATVVNNLLQSYNQTTSTPYPLFDNTQLANMSRGLSYLGLGKQSLFSSLGSRYLVVKQSYDLYANYQYLMGSGDSGQNGLGQTQETWLRNTLLNSTQTWRVVGSSVSLTSLLLDLANTDGLPADFIALLNSLPSAYRHLFYFNVDQWDGFVNKRAALVELLDSVTNTVSIAGDIHASYVSQHGERTFEFTGTSVSSGTFSTLASNQATEIGLSNVEAITASIDYLLRRANPMISYANSNANGVSIMQVSADSIEVDYHLLAAEVAFENHYNDRQAIRDNVQTLSFQVKSGKLSLI
ncbi:phosphodiesterase/alkaline phosphatase D [Beggiatoa alba B18LD]|uniref:Phosphodiesterase/alkaline phosphatase D n=1 Tax=Beggiatoa alba B18LD TaxID=395493 RepID=I3CCE3_9GAMM|nr:alkaline phosphatase D family protein [Beggiatoa alba]EIJ41286.1 phosphodiesterase/alkaline phosphatase D [Beggiatoa alba B18LD]